MSGTKPYPSDWREQGWGETWQMTPRQRRRTVKKMRRMGDDTVWKPASSYAGPTAKNRRTPGRRNRSPYLPPVDHAGHEADDTGEFPWGLTCLDCSGPEDQEPRVQWTTSETETKGAA